MVLDISRGVKSIPPPGWQAPGVVAVKGVIYSMRSYKYRQAYK